MDQTFSEYQLVKQLAQKTSSSLYLAQSSTIPTERVVVKVFDGSGLATTQEQERFQQEVSRLSQLSHPYIVPLLGGGILENDHPYLVSTYIPRDSLRNRLHALYPARLPLETVLRIIVQVGQAFSYAHAWNILHNNVKSENVLFTADDTILLTDFTLNSIAESYGPDIRPNLRTACYMAPECFVGKSSAASDQYALACLAYELLAGHPPFTAAALSTWQLKHTSEQPIPLSNVAPSVPEHSAAAIDRALSKDPSGRFADIASFIEAITATSLRVALSHFTTPHQAIRPEPTLPQVENAPIESDEPPSGMASLVEFDTFQPEVVPQIEFDAFQASPVEFGGPELQEQQEDQEYQASEIEDTEKRAALPSFAAIKNQAPSLAIQEFGQGQMLPHMETVQSNPDRISKLPLPGNHRTKRSRWIILSITCLCLVGIAVASQFLLPANAAQQASKLSSSISPVQGTATTVQATPTLSPTAPTATQATNDQREIPMATPTLAPTATLKPTPSPTATHSATPTAKPWSPSPTPVPTHAATPTPRPTPTPTPTKKCSCWIFCYCKHS